MREALEKIENERLLFRATFERFGLKSAYRGNPIKTCLFVNITCGENTVADHVWFTCGIQFEKMNLQQGDVVEFYARVTVYTKGYLGRRDIFDAPPPSYDYRLSNPSRVKKIQY